MNGTRQYERYCIIINYSIVEYSQSRCKSHQNSRVFKELKQQTPSAYNSINHYTFKNSANLKTEFSKVLIDKFGISSYIR